MAKKCIHIFHSKALCTKFTQNWDFRFENKPSGNPAFDESSDFFLVDLNGCFRWFFDGFCGRKIFCVDGQTSEVLKHFFKVGGNVSGKKHMLAG
jgi:hypothetical protein